MSQFGYEEEQGENKARADIYAVISPPLIPPGIRPHIECMLLCVMLEKGALLRCLLFCYLHENNPRGVTM